MQPWGTPLLQRPAEEPKEAINGQRDSRKPEKMSYKSLGSRVFQEENS